MDEVDDKRLAIRHGRTADQDEIIKLSRRVQDKLTASGSLQQIGPLQQDAVAQAIANQQCYVLERYQSSSLESKTIGCALSRSLQAGYFLSTSDFDMKSFPSPWLYLHSIMLEPEAQGRGIGKSFVAEVVNKIASLHHDCGILFLDCWAGNQTLRRFYAEVGFTFTAVIPEEDYEIAVFYRPLHAMNVPSAVG
ncbi:hypothetical protein M409DRAFT_24463 [Zasmidium cellare ATCC 36951]|uniref:N-acetyltransferase domain-containing protein n=1 Tax=Zasmidium cellare ATCC 36951 TaxID=1080233 RepID=A0A6A6CDA8_ZASCE|nr:uncharacterized protein M409DRAFT_24463 [Zasmidium cellare ATCC 36951]KAF2165075.1 hypothetical protein M409DRAFT_24463 [Zasmidium cellare ATCC 36951]